MFERTKKFHEEMVTQTVAAFLATDWSARHGFLAAIVLNQQADYWAHDEAGTRPANELRRELAAQCPSFQLIWDVADASKHCELTQRTATRTIDRAGQIRSGDGTLNSFGFNEAEINGMPPVYVQRNDGTSAILAPAVQQVALMWSDRFAALTP